MSTIKNLNIRPNARNRRLKLVAGVLATVIVAIGTTVAVNAYNVALDTERKETIVEFYGEESNEKTIIDYIDISEKLHKLNLDEYTCSEELISKYNLSNELMDSSKLNLLIDKFNLINKSMYSKNLDKQSENIDLILNLKNQEKLVNGYIYDTGHFVAYTDVKKATKEYAAETFGIDAKNIEFSYNYESNDGGNYAINNKIDKYEKQTYNLDSLFPKNQENQIRTGISSMVEIDPEVDNNLDDNDKYNKERNKDIKVALYNSATLEMENNENNLYNESLANKFK